MKHLYGLMAFMLVLELIVFTAPCHGAKMKVQALDYGATWKRYMERDTTLDPSEIYPYDDCFRKAAKKYNVPLTLLLALARGESDFNPRAKSSASCYGIMQIQWPGTATDLGFNSIKELYQPCKNIMAGARYIKMMIQRYDGDVHLAVAAYNYGPGRISKNMSDSSLPQGANWYSGYIYHHLQQVLKGTTAKQPVKIKRAKYRPSNKIPVILFHNPLFARNFFTYFEDNAPEVRLDWFRTSLGETYIVLLFDTEKEKRNSIEQMKKLGYYLDVIQTFQ